VARFDEAIFARGSATPVGAFGLATTHASDFQESLLSGKNIQNV
jgi:hypothetical protein